MASNQAVLDAVARRLQEAPEQVLPTLRVLGDLDALPGPGASRTVALARKVNADRLSAELDRFRQSAYSTSEVRPMLGGVTRQAVAARVAAGSLLSLEISGRSYFPDWQFGPDGVLPGVSQLISALRADGRGALAADALMRTPLPETGGRSPAELLAAGDVATALHYVVVATGGF